MRCRLILESPSGNAAGGRFYLSYTGSAPSSANCVTLATDISSAWGSHLASVTPSFWSLNEVDVLDIATDSGNSGVYSTPVDGTRSGTEIPEQVATNVEFEIARRYRGGKPRMYLPPGCSADVTNDQIWDSSFVTAVNTGIAAFFAALEALSIGSMGTLAHVNLSYYQGWQGGERYRAGLPPRPAYRAAAKHDVVTGYVTKQLLSSQKRRRTATSP